MLNFFQKLLTKTTDLSDQELSENDFSLQRQDQNNGFGSSEQSAKLVDHQIKQLNYLKVLGNITDQLFPENLISFKGQEQSQSFSTAEQLSNIVDEQFDELYYLKVNSDVVAAIASGAYNSGLEHYLAYGKLEGRAPCNKPIAIVDDQFDELYYLKANADVAAAVNEGRLNSGFEHYQRSGKKEGRAPSKKPLVKVDEHFDEVYYLKANADVSAAIDDGRLNSGFQHFQGSGKWQGRAPCNKSGTIKRSFVYVWKM